MQRYLIQQLTFLLFCLVPLNIEASSLISIDTSSVVICPAVTNGLPMPSFVEPECTSTRAVDINPQDRLIWVKANLNIPDAMYQNKQPHSVYVSGKTSSQVYFNGHYLGQNGTPNLNASDEFPGKIDAMFYVPPELIKQGANELVLLLSSHHGFLELQSPLNFVGFGTYSDPTHFIQRTIWQAFFPLGALILGTIYFAVSCFGVAQRKTNLLFLAMGFIASAQLLLELSRAIFSYSYPFQDLRLMLIAMLSTLFGILLLVYVVLKFVNKNKAAFILLGALTTLIAVLLSPGFDPKTAIAIFVPSVISTLIIVFKVAKIKSIELSVYLTFFILLTSTIIFNLNGFHALHFYYIITGALCFLFIQQAIKLNREQNKRKQEQELVAKLQFKLEQNEQKIKPNKIKISSAGKIELISTEQVTFCMASGDYVEINLQNGRQLLFSGNLKELEKQLPETFLRVHRSYVVNMEYIQTLRKTSQNDKKGGTASSILVLEGGLKVPVSRRIMPTIRHAIGS